MKNYRIYDESVNADTNIIISAENEKEALKIAKKEHGAKYHIINNKGTKFIIPKFYAIEEK